MNKSADVVERFQTAMAKGDAKAARALMHDDMKFHGPLDQFDRPEPYLQALGQLGPMIEKVDVLREFADGDEVARFCDLHFKPPLPKTFVAEWYHVKDGKIASIKIAFDARAFAAMRAGGGH
jgi:ketosteroid isomerase-like protein